MKSSESLKKLPIQKINWTPLITVLGETNRRLARYDGILHHMVNPEILLSPLVTQEAVLSSRIEGTQASLEEVLEYEAETRRGKRAEPDTERQKDIQEIINYRNAMYFAEQQLRQKPITLNMIKGIHSILLDSVRGQNKGRGNFRRTQNWIGPPGCDKEEATYVPPAYPETEDYLDNLEKYINSDDKDVLVQLAIVHGQFELIHPFLDGNGRVGRILIPLFLYEKSVLSSPMFYISSYLETHRREYYDLLRGITEESDWDSWIKFFLEGVKEQAKENIEKAEDCLNLYERMKSEISEVTGSKYAIQALDMIFKRPIFSTTDFIEDSEITRPTAHRLLKTLEEAGILSEIREGRGRRPAILVFPELLNIVRT